MTIIPVTMMKIWVIKLTRTLPTQTVIIIVIVMETLIIVTMMIPAPDPRT